MVEIRKEQNMAIMESVSLMTEPSVRLKRAKAWTNNMLPVRNLFFSSGKR